MCQKFGNSVAVPVIDAIFQSILDQNILSITETVNNNVNIPKNLNIKCPACTYINDNNTCCIICNANLNNYTTDKMNNLVDRTNSYTNKIDIFSDNRSSKRHTANEHIEDIWSDKNKY